MYDWNNKAKRVLKSELIKRGISNSELANLLSNLGISETKSSIDSKISRGTFSAAFLLQCMTAINCKKLEFEIYNNNLKIVAEPKGSYQKLKND